MAITKVMNSKANIKQYSAADLPINAKQPVIARMPAVESTLNQTVINLPFLVDTVNAQDTFFLAIDGKLLSLGSSYDYQMSSVDLMGMSNQVTLNNPIDAGLNIQAWKIGLKKESELGIDQRFINAYNYLGNAFQGYVDQSVKMVATSTTGTPAAGTFYSSVVGRAPIPDLSANLKARMGVDRIMTQNGFKIQNEFGPNGEPVWGAQNDTFGQIRMVGNWYIGQIGNHGQMNWGNSVGDYIEVTFYGTGLNWLTYANQGTSQAVASVDGGAEGSNLMVTQAGSFVSVNYSPNVVVPVVKGLSLGIHTVKIRLSVLSGNALNTYGFDILNESANVLVAPGTAYNAGKAITSNSLYSTSYNSVATGTRGGRVLMYQKADGSIGSAFTAVGSSQYLTASDHSNEEPVRVHNFREFGAGKGSDFSIYNGYQSSAFTLDDGSTTLNGNGVYAQNVAGDADSLRASGSGSFILINFVGTGLDIVSANNDVNARTTAMYVDGSSVGNISIASNELSRRVRICSGLPYGTHTVKFSYNSPDTVFIKDFIIYQPKTPLLPSGAVALGSYNVMANYVPSSNPAPNSSSPDIAAGVLRKAMSSRETTLTGTWGTNSLDGNFGAGWNTSSNTPGDTASFTFFGTGFEWKGLFQAGGQNNTMSIDGSTNLSGYTTSFLQSSGGATFTPSTGAFAGSCAQQWWSLSVTGLPLGLHTVKMVNNAGQWLYVDTLDIITPIHSHKSNVQADMQNSLSVGSQGIEDNRLFSPIPNQANIKNWAQAKGVSSSPTTTSTSPVPMPDMAVTIKTSGQPLEISYAASLNDSSPGSYVYTAISVDGVLVSVFQITTSAPSGSGYIYVNTDKAIVPVSAGTHLVQVVWLVSGGTGSAYSTNRSLIAKEM